MIIRLGTVSEMCTLWQHPKSTSNFFINQLKSENAEFWTIEDNQRLLGELYLFKRLSDTDFADGSYRAYLCSFRIVEELQGKGLGTKLINRVIDRLRELSFTEVTIGVEEVEKANMHLYQRLDFSETIKRCLIDPCDVDSNFQPLYCNEYLLLRKFL